MARSLKQQAAAAWRERWLASVTAQGRSMSQRRLAAVEDKGGGLALVRRAARARGVHLLVLDDDAGRPVVVASVRPFRVVC